MKDRRTHLTSITARLDAVANIVEKHNPKIALAIDLISDRFEKRADEKTENYIDEILEKNLDHVEFLKEKMNKADLKVQQTKLPKMFSEIVDKAKKLYPEKGHDYHGSGYISQTMPSELWDKFSKKFDDLDQFEIVDLIDEMEKWAKDKIRDLNDELKKG